MIRVSRISVMRVLAISLSLTASTCFLADLARAGDDDGVQGYSMKLKNKTFTTNEDLSGSGLIATGVTPAKNEPVVPQFTIQTNSATKTNFAFFANVRAWLRWFIW